MRPTRLKVVNFLDIREASLSFPSPGIYYVTGELHDPQVGILSNGAGKSTLLMAFNFALTGSLKPAIQGNEVALNEVIGPAGEKVWTEIVLEGGGQIYEITRSRSTHEQHVGLRINGEDRSSKRNPSSTHKRIVELLGLDLFRHTHYIPQVDQKVGFLYSTDAERKGLVGQLYGRAQLDAIANRVVEMVGQEERVAAAMTKKIDLLIGSIQQVEQQIFSTKESLDKLQTVQAVDREALGAELKEIDHKISFIPPVIFHQNQMRTAQEKAREYGRALETLRAKQMGQAHSIKDLKEKIREARHLLDHLEPRGTCPTCGQTLRGADPDQLARKTRTTRRALKTLRFQRQLALQAVEDLKVLIQDNLREQERFTQEQEVHRRQQEAVQKLLRPLQDRRQQVLALLSTKGEGTGRDELLGLLEAQEKALEIQRVDLQAQEVKRARTLTLTRRYGFMAQAYRHEIRSMVFESCSARFTQAVRRELRGLYGRVLDVRFDATSTKRSGEEEDRFAVMISRRNRPGYWYSALRGSGAQKRILSFAILLAMRKMVKSQVDVLLLDEALEHLDPQATDRAFRCIREIATNQVVLYVTHDHRALPPGARQIHLINREGVVSVS